MDCPNSDFHSHPYSGSSHYTDSLAHNYWTDCRRGFPGFADHNSDCSLSCDLGLAYAQLARKDCYNSAVAGSFDNSGSLDNLDSLDNLNSSGNSGDPDGRNHSEREGSSDTEAGLDSSPVGNNWVEDKIVGVGAVEILSS